MLDVEVAPDADLEPGREVLVDTAVAMGTDQAWAEAVLEPPTS